MEKRETKEKIAWNLIRSARKTIAIQVDAEGTVTVRAPQRCARAVIEDFVQEKQEWICQKQKELKERAREQTQRREKLPKWREEDIQRYQMRARQVLKQRTEYFAAQMGVDFGRLTVRNQKTRWGSCSARGNLNFNWRLILAPPTVLDYVVVHELAHRKEMNHSERFWRQVEAVLPDYHQRRQWLRENGDWLMSYPS